jgi:hypothetical protein
MTESWLSSFVAIFFGLVMAIVGFLVLAIVAIEIGAV